LLIVWGENVKVKNSYIQNTPGGEIRYNKLMENVKFSEELVESKYKNS